MSVQTIANKLTTQLATQNNEVKEKLTQLKQTMRVIEKNISHLQENSRELDFFRNLPPSAVPKKILDISKEIDLTLASSRQELREVQKKVNDLEEKALKINETFTKEIHDFEKTYTKEMQDLDYLSKHLINDLTLHNIKTYELELSFSKEVGVSISDDRIPTTLEEVIPKLTALTIKIFFQQLLVFSGNLKIDTEKVSALQVLSDHVALERKAIGDLAKKVTEITESTINPDVINYSYNHILSCERALNSFIFQVKCSSF